MKFNVTGYNLDNLLKKLYIKKIKLFNLKRLSQTEVQFEVEDKAYKRVKKYVANFKVKNNKPKAKRIGMFFVSNISIVLAVFVGAIFCLFLGNYTWQIEIFGLKDLTKNEVVEVLNQNGVKVGKISTKSAEQIENLLLENINRIAQVSVIKQGTAIIINLSEKLVYEPTEFLPIVATFSGIVERINIITGTTNVKVGDYVNVGDVLVLPFNMDANNNKVFVKPLAEIYGKIFVVGKTSLKTQEIVLKRTGNSQVVYDYYLFNNHIFSGKRENLFAKFEFVSYNENVSKLVPLKRKVTTYFELKETVVEHNLVEEQDAVLLKSQQLAHEMLPQDAKIVDEKTEKTLVDDTLTACTILTVEGKING
ncbi:MAG: sporulation protein YqfD [Clostridia bacterium]|nr:sporulation protein YqfD [Clostridia bacterium]